MNSEVKETAGGTDLYDLLAWIEVNKKRLIIGAVVLTVIGFGVWIYNWSIDRREASANEALLALRPPLTSTNPVPVAAAAYLKVANDFPNTSAAERAEILAAGALFTENNYLEAQAEFRKFLAKYPSSSWAPTAALGAAAALEAQNKSDEALTAYQEVTTRYGRQPVATDAKLAIARLHEAKNHPEIALKIYEELSKPDPQNPRVTEASVLKEQLLKRYPKLAPTPTPAPTALMATNTVMPMVKGSNSFKITPAITPNRSTNKP